jgi:hypothetical protein
MGKAGCLDPSRVSLTMLPTRFNHRAVRLIPRVIYEMVINFLGKRSPSPGLERGGGILCDTWRVVPQPFDAGGIQLFLCL